MTSTGPRRRPVSGAVLAVALAVAAVVSLGCRAREPEPAPPPRSAVTPPPTATPIRIAMIGKSSTNPIFLPARTGAEAAAKDLSGKLGVAVEVVWMTPPLEDATLQAQRIAQAVREGARAILISCSDADKVTPAIDAAVEAGVDVMTFDSDAPRSKRFAYYGVDDRRLGQDVMAELAKLLGGHGKVAILAGNQHAPNLQKRVQGVRDEAARHPGIQIIGTFFHVERPEDAATEVMRVESQHRDLAGWAMVGGWALFTKTLLNELDPQKVKIVSVDALPPELPYIEKGLAPVLLAQQPYLWGNVGVTKIIDKVARGKDVPVIVPMDPVRVTQDTLGSWARQLRQWGLGDVPEEYLRLK